jgi:hypothetical protein
VHIAVTYAHTNPPTTVNFPCHLLDATPSLVFRALNRIDDLETDLARLPARYRTLRTQLETAAVPSMSAGDAFTVVNDDGVALVHWVCEPTGWSRSIPPRTDRS